VNVIKSRWRECAGHVAHMGNKKFTHFDQICKGIDHLGYLGIGGRTLLKWILEK
jgi:hypothetical protein